MRYALDELFRYEKDHSDALAPSSQEAHTSLAGEAALVRPATAGELLKLAAAQKAMAASIAQLAASQQAIVADVRSVQVQLSSLVGSAPAANMCSPSSAGSLPSNGPSPPLGQVASVDGSNGMSHFVLVRNSMEGRGLESRPPPTGPLTTISLLSCIPSCHTPANPNAFNPDGGAARGPPIHFHLHGRGLTRCHSHHFLDSLFPPGWPYTPCQVLGKHPAAAGCTIPWANHPEAPVLGGCPAALDGARSPPQAPHGTEGLAP